MKNRSYSLDRVKNYNIIRKFYVYAYLFERNTEYGKKGMIRYFGKGCYNRYKEGHKDISLPTDFDKFSKIICDNMSEVDALQLEMLLIYQYGRQYNNTGCLQNRSAGSKVPSDFEKTEKYYENMSNRLKGRKQSPEQIANRVQSRRDNNSYGQSEETKEILSKKTKDAWTRAKEEDRPYRSKQGGGKPKGFKMTPEQLAHYRNSRKPLTMEQKANISAGTKKAMNNPELRKHLSEMKLNKQKEKV